MAEIAHLAWYRQGTVSVTNGSTVVTGSGTRFLTAGINPGAALRIGALPHAWEIKRVVSDTELELAVPCGGLSTSNTAYSIDRNHQFTLPADIAARLAKAMGNWEARYDIDMATITGKSAYEIAVEEGYTGTKAQWLESLKAAGEWNTLNERTEILTIHNAHVNNSFFRDKDITAQFNNGNIYTNIANGTFNDVYPGDYATLPIDGSTTLRVMGCQIHNLVGTHILAMLWNNKWRYPYNDAGTVEGHFYSSKMFTEHLPYILDKIREVIPDEHIIAVRENIGDAINGAGACIHRITENVKIGLPSTFNITERYLTDNRAYDYMGQAQQFPAFFYSLQLRLQMQFAWLGENTNSATWNMMIWHGFAPAAMLPTYTVPELNNTPPKVVPYILLG